jgi:hypothetical protein
LRKSQRILLRSSLAPKSFWLPGPVLLILLEEVTVMMMMTTVILILLVLKDHPVWLVPPVVVKAPWAAMEVAVQQILFAGQLLQIPTSIFLFRLFPRSRMPSTSGINKLQLLVLPS